jgi:hypothetical protein
MTQSKAAQARHMFAQGATKAEIRLKLGITGGNLATALGIKPETRKRGFHANLNQKWKPKHDRTPLGTCVAWLVVEGRAQQCGKPAERQLCDECAERLNGGAKHLRDWGNAA